MDESWTLNALVAEAEVIEPLEVDDEFITRVVLDFRSTYLPDSSNYNEDIFAIVSYRNRRGRGQGPFPTRSGSIIAANSSVQDITANTSKGAACRTTIAWRYVRQG